MSDRRMMPLRDGQIIKSIRKLHENFPALAATIHTGIYSLNLTPENKEQLKALEQANGYAIGLFDLTYGRVHFSYITMTTEDRGFAKVTVRQTQNSPLDDDFAFHVKCLHDFAATPVDASLPDSKVALAGFKNIESALEGAVSQFAAMQASFLAKNEEMREQHSQEIARFKDEIEQDRKRLSDEIETQRSELSEARKKLDDRSNTHARREIRNEIKTAITNALSEKGYTAKLDEKRTFMRYAYLVSLAILLIFSAYTLYILGDTAIQSNPQGLWVIGIKSTISGLSFLGLLLLYLKWEAQWLSQQANFETALASTRVDIDRANWIAESLLEWNKESPEQPMPHELIQSFSRRLFDWDARTQDHHAASDSLASAILGSAAKLQIGPNGADLEFDQKGIRKLKKAEG